MWDEGSGYPRQGGEMPLDSQGIIEARVQKI